MNDDARLIVFRSRLRDGIREQYDRHAGEIYELGVKMPGFLGIKDFVAEDGERVAIAEFDSAAHLAAWREQPDHRAAQQRGRDDYYTEYSIQICNVVRESRFAAATRERREQIRDPARLIAIAERWLACFARRDLDGLLALYADDATHTSPKIRARHPDTGGLLRGRPALRAWWADSFERLPELRYEPTSITADARRAYVEYTRKLPGEPDLPIAEVFDVERELIVASRVFHG
jgi:heme-degrading monooxygenase HmoA/ketosteroid isomerase-like protein